MSKTRLPRDYETLFTEVKERVRAAQYQALKSVNKELVGLYWDIGRMIVERQVGATWGKSIVQRLAGDLQREFPGIKGFSSQNLWYMRQFYLEYQDIEKLQPLVGEISWSHNLVIMSRCKEPLEREFYLRMTRKFGWSKNVLIHQIENQSYEKTLLGQTNFDRALTPGLRAQAKLAIKDEYTFEFLELSEEHSERELERALIGRVEDFLRAIKSAVTKRINEMRQMPGKPLWQRNYYELIIRNDDEWNRIRQYIIDNPAKWETDHENPDAANGMGTANCRGTACRAPTEGWRFDLRKQPDCREWDNDKQIYNRRDN